MKVTVEKTDIGTKIYRENFCTQVVMELIDTS